MNKSTKFLADMPIRQVMLYGMAILTDNMSNFEGAEKENENHTHPQIHSMTLNIHLSNYLPAKCILLHSLRRSIRTHVAPAGPPRAAGRRTVCPAGF